MRSSLIGFGAVVAASLAASAFAQSVPMSAAHAQAQANKQPAQCAKEVAKMQDQVGLRLQQPAIGAETRGSVNSELQTAANAAAAGNEEACWQWYDRAQQTVR